MSSPASNDNGDGRPRATSPVPPLPAAITRESLNERSAGSLPGLLGVEIDAVSDGAVLARLPLRPDLLAPNGFLHAASVVGLADTACGYGCMRSLPEGAAGFTTVELKSNFLGTVRDGVIRCSARLVHGGRTTQVWDAEVFDGAGENAIALFRCTQMILYPRAAVGP